MEHKLNALSLLEVERRKDGQVCAHCRQVRFLSWPFLQLCSRSGTSSIRLASSDKVHCPLLSPYLTHYISHACQIHRLTHPNSFKFVNHFIIKVYPFLGVCSVLMHMVQTFIMLSFVNAAVKFECGQVTKRDTNGMDDGACANWLWLRANGYP